LGNFNLWDGPVKERFKRFFSAPETKTVRASKITLVANRWPKIQARGEPPSVWLGAQNFFYLL
jgi:hypothetical protein